MAWDSVRSCVTTSPAATNKHTDLVKVNVRCTFPCIFTYISVSMPTPWAVAGPNGQLANR